MEVERFVYFRPRGTQRLAYGDGMRQNLRGSLLARLQVPFFVLAQALAIRRHARRGEVRYVNSHWLVPQGLSAAWARGAERGARGRFRHVLHVHAADVYLLERLPFGDRIARYVLDRADAVFADGSHVRDTLERLVGRPTGARLQPMGVRTDYFRYPVEADPVESRHPQGFLLFVGRFVEKKGVVFLLRAMPRVLREHPGIGLVLIGYGPLEGDLLDEVSSLGLEDSVDFVGRRPHAEVVRYLQACRAAIVPSIIDSYGETEGMPTVVVEVMAAGARVVASAVDGIPDVVRHEENGWLCREKDPEDLAEKILLALSDPTPSAVVRAGSATADLHDWSRVAQNYRDCFEGLTESHPGAAD